ncbi:MAG: response regulator transcription factor [Actinomycetota bacterium]|nr:response regulator transcription factor [Actinomycetota bacterium]
MNPSDTPRILIVDDHEIFAELLADSLSAAGMTVVGICGTVGAALRATGDDQPDLVILDHELPEGTGAGAVAELKKQGTRTRVLMLTAAPGGGVLQEAMAAGCDGFVTKRQSTSSVLAAVRSVLRGETPISSDVAGGLVGRRPVVLGGDLTSREDQVLQLVGAGMSNRDIAEHLRISVNTVRNHVQQVLAKLGAHSKLEAVAIASRNGLLQSDRVAGNRQ